MTIRYGLLTCCPLIYVLQFYCTKKEKEKHTVIFDKLSDIVLHVVLFIFHHILYNIFITIYHTITTVYQLGLQYSIIFITLYHFLYNIQWTIFFQMLLQSSIMFINVYRFIYLLNNGYCLSTRLEKFYHIHHCLSFSINLVWNSWLYYHCL